MKPKTDAGPGCSRRLRLRPVCAPPARRFYEQGPPLRVQLGGEGCRFLQEGLNSLVFEYLLKLGLPRTLESFLEEVDGPPSAQLANFPAALLAAFDRMEGEAFMAVWTRFVPKFLRQRHAPTAALEFKLVAAFALGGDCPAAEAIEEFGRFLALNGEELSKLEELLPFFALPFARQPEEHPLVRTVRGGAWRADLRRSLERFLASIYACGDPPRLLALYEQSRQPALAMPAQPDPAPWERLRGELELAAQKERLSSGERGLTEVSARLAALCAGRVEFDRALPAFVAARLPEAAVPARALDLLGLKRSLFVLVRSAAPEAHPKAVELLQGLTAHLDRAGRLGQTQSFVDFCASDFLGPERRDKGLRLWELAESASEELATALQGLEVVVAAQPAAAAYLAACAPRQPRRGAALLKFLRQTLGEGGVSPTVLEPFFAGSDGFARESPGPSPLPTEGDEPAAPSAAESVEERALEPGEIHLAEQLVEVVAGEGRLSPRP